jgi:hypothetical protein
MMSGLVIKFCLKIRFWNEINLFRDKFKINVKNGGI